VVEFTKDHNVANQLEFCGQCSGGLIYADGVYRYAVEDKPTLPPLCTGMYPSVRHYIRLNSEQTIYQRYSQTNVDVKSIFQKCCVVGPLLRIGVVGMSQPLIISICIFFYLE